MSIDKALHALETFQGDSLTESLAGIERWIVGLGAEDVRGLCANRGINGDFLDSAIAVKHIAGQINVIILAAVILRSLPGLLEPGELVESVSLGAGSTDHQFDLETNLRVAEYKFVDWQGGVESIGQNRIFKNFFELAEHQTDKQKYLYVVGTDDPLTFFNGGRALTSVLNRHSKILAHIQDKYGHSVVRVRDYYEIKKSDVLICDVTPYIERSAKVTDGQPPHCR